MCGILNLGRGPVVKVWVIHVTQSRTLGQRWSGWPFPRDDSCAQRMHVNRSPWALVLFSHPVCLPGETGYSASIHIWSEILMLYQRRETQKGLFLSAGLPNGMVHTGLRFVPPPLSALYPDWPIIHCFYLPRQAYCVLLHHQMGCVEAGGSERKNPLPWPSCFSLVSFYIVFFFKGK